MTSAPLASFQAADRIRLRYFVFANIVKTAELARHGQRAVSYLMLPRGAIQANQDELRRDIGR